MEIKLYTNDLELERLKQNKVADSENRIPVLKNRIARAKDPKLVAILMVATERGDRTIAAAARAKLGLPKGTKVKDVVTVVESRRPSRSKKVQALVEA